MTTSSPSTRLPWSADQLPAEWVQLLRLLPGFDPFVMACDPQTGEAVYGFDVAAAGHAIGWIEQKLKFVKGRKAGTLFVLSPWQRSIIANLFGWKKIETGYRRFREALLYVAKKNGKSAFVAAIIIYVMANDGELGAELYSAAASREQAALIFAHAAGMVRQNPNLKRRFTLYGEKGGSVNKSIVDPETMSAYKCLAANADTADGGNVHLAAVDELHRHRNPELADVLERSMAERAQPLFLGTTTADYNRPSLCNDKLNYARQVLANDNNPAKPGWDPTFLPVVYEAGKDDDWEDPETWKKANPNLNVTVPLEYLRAQAQKAKDQPSKLNSFKRLNLNIVTDADEAWLMLDKWDRCSTASPDGNGPQQWRRRMLEQLAGRRCTAALDLSSTNDLTCVCLLFPDDGWVVLPWFFMPRDKAHAREREHRVPYLTWAEQGFIELTDGDYVDQEQVLARALACCDTFAVPDLAVDRYMAQQIEMETRKHGIEVVHFGQGFASMSAPSKALETRVMAGEMDHGHNPVLRWCAGNCVIERDPADNIKPSKKRSAEKIDGIVALVMCIGRAMARPQQRPSMYEDPGNLAAW